MQPLFDKDGYPAEETLEAIRKWPFADRDGFWKFVEGAWSDYGHVKSIGEDPGNLDHLELVTGGWSGNESIIAAIERNQMIYSMCWQKSERGGYYVYSKK
jgi:hypothetical protein